MKTIYIVLKDTCVATDDNGDPIEARLPYAICSTKEMAEVASLMLNEEEFGIEEFTLDAFPTSQDCKFLYEVDYSNERFSVTRRGWTKNEVFNHEPHTQGGRLFLKALNPEEALTAAKEFLLKYEREQELRRKQPIKKKIKIQFSHGIQEVDVEISHDGIYKILN